MLSSEKVERIRKMYPEGAKVELLRTEDHFTNLKGGERGTVDYVDDAGTVHILWDNGSNLGMIPKVTVYVLWDNGFYLGMIPEVD